MKNRIILSLFALLIMGCSEKDTLMFFDSRIGNQSPIEFNGHDTNWLAVAELDEIYHVIIAGEQSAQAIHSSLAKLISEKYPVDEVITTFIYTTNQDTTQVNITLDKTHAMGLVRKENINYYFDYFERQDNRFVLVPELSGTVNAGIDMDDLRLFHFASSPGQELPLISTIFDFRLKPSEATRLSEERNRSMGDGLLMNMDYNKGMNTLDIYGEKFYSAMRADDNPGGSFCGGNRNCPSGTATCITAPGGPDMVCDAPSDGGGCFNAVLTHAMAMLNTNIPPFDLPKLYEFKNSFLMKYPKGREFISYMYLAGRYMKMDKASMNNYLDLILEGEKLIQRIQGADDDSVLFDAQYVTVFSTFIQNHRNTKSKKLSQAMSTLEKDLNFLNGMTKKQFLNYLQNTNVDKVKT